MKYVEAPNSIEGMARPAIFLAGGISNCEDWQREVSSRVCAEVTRGTLLNPRRADFPIDDPGAAEGQINWEQQALWASDVVSFWFAKGTSVQPIVMFELGCHLGRYCIGGGPKRILVGIDPEYARKQDVILQIQAHARSLNGPWIIVPHFSLKEHIEKIISTMETIR